jgi:hypothetical protein
VCFGIFEFVKKWQTKKFATKVGNFFDEKFFRRIRNSLIRPKLVNPQKISLDPVCEKKKPSTKDCCWSGAYLKASPFRRICGNAETPAVYPRRRSSSETIKNQEKHHTDPSLSGKGCQIILGTIYQNGNTYICTYTK